MPSPRVRKTHPLEPPATTMPGHLVPFDLGLDEAQERRAAALHRDSVIVDLLYQGPQGGLVHPDNLSETKELGPILDIRAGKE